MYFILFYSHYFHIHTIFFIFIIFCMIHIQQNFIHYIYLYIYSNYYKYFYNFITGSGISLVGQRFSKNSWKKYWNLPSVFFFFWRSVKRFKVLPGNLAINNHWNNQYKIFKKCSNSLAMHMPRPTRSTRPMQPLQLVLDWRFALVLLPLRYL